MRAFAGTFVGTLVGAFEWSNVAVRVLCACLILGHQEVQHMTLLESRCHGKCTPTRVQLEEVVGVPKEGTVV